VGHGHGQRGSRATTAAGSCSGRCSPPAGSRRRRGPSIWMRRETSPFARASTARPSLRTEDSQIQTCRPRNRAARPTSQLLQPGVGPRASPATRLDAGRELRWLAPDDLGFRVAPGVFTTGAHDYGAASSTAPASDQQRVSGPELVPDRSFYLEGTSSPVPAAMRRILSLVRRHAGRHRGLAVSDSHVLWPRDTYSEQGA